MAGDAVEVAPDQYRVLFENDRVRLLEYRGQPGDKTAMHSHPDVLACADRGQVQIRDSRRSGFRSRAWRGRVHVC